jgi:methylmalonyl-CoA mutase
LFVKNLKIENYSAIVSQYIGVVVDIKIDDFFDKPSLSDWTKETKRILKIEEDSVLEKKLNKKSLEGITYKTLYSEEVGPIQLNTFPEDRIFAREIVKTDDIANDIAGGIHHFFTTTPQVLDKSATLIQIVQNKKYTIFGDRVFVDLIRLFESFDFNMDSFKKEVIKIHNKHQCDFFIDTRLIHDAGGSIVQELVSAFSFAKFSYENFDLSESCLYFGLSLDSKYFLNISKLRALRYTWETLLENEEQSTANFKIIAFNSLREHSLYDPYMNMLRNTASSSAAFVGGADIIAPSSFDILKEVYGNLKLSSVGQRQSRNMLHVLNEESGLTKVLDASKGSYTIESLTKSLIEQSFELFKSYEEDGTLLSKMEDFSKGVKENGELRLEQVKKRKIILSGINDYANTEENLSKEMKNISVVKNESTLFPHMRLAQDFEQLRYKTECLKIPKKVKLVLFGDQSKLSGRKMFTINYFESIGLECEPLVFSGSKLELNNKDYLAVVFCANDSDYETFLDTIIESQKFNLPVFISGKKFEHTNCTNIYMGQNMYDVLNTLVTKGDK